MGPGRRPANTPRILAPMDWNQVKALFESLQTTLGMVAEDVRALRGEFGSFKKALFDVAEDVKLSKTLVQANTKAIAELKTDVKEIKDRLSAAEAKFPA